VEDPRYCRKTVRHGVKGFYPYPSSEVRAASPAA
jgi:hypothetical protein